jgi:hypothetical protein
MAENKKINLTQIVVLFSYLVMVIVNALANALPINGITTGAVSDSFPNLFAPTGLTFSIWGLIYLLLAGYSAYQLGLFRQDSDAGKQQLLNSIGILFAISSLVNAAWIFSWHYLSIGLSLVLMLVILGLLIAINLKVDSAQLSTREKLFIKLPFAVYFGWITVATVANVTSLLVYSGWRGFGIAEQTWAVFIIAVGFLIGAATTLRFKSIAYGLVIIWAYIGIWIKHTAAAGFTGSYPAVIATVIISIILMVAVVIFLMVKGKNSVPVAS